MNKILFKTPPNIGATALINFSDDLPKTSGLTDNIAAGAVVNTTA
jgi:hypothetical protein